MLDKKTLELVTKIFKICSKQQLKIRALESCTGGLLAAYFTHLPGSSNFFDRGLVTYSNSSKSELCDIANTVIEKYGAVSFETALKMAEALAAPRIITISTTGLLGPEGDGSNTKIGTIYVGINYDQNHTYIKRWILKGDREQLQHAAVQNGIALLKNLCASN